MVKSGTIRLASGYHSIMYKYIVQCTVHCTSKNIMSVRNIWKQLSQVQNTRNPSKKFPVIPYSNYFDKSIWITNFLP